MKRMRLTIGRKLAALVGLEIVAIAVILAIASSQMRSTLMEERRLAIRNVVDVADNTVKHYAKLAEQGKLSVTEAQAQAMTAVSVQRYAGAEYVWINDLQHRMLYHPSPKLNGKDTSDLKDANGKRIVGSMVDVVKQRGEGYVEYVWPHTEQTPPVLKVSYVRGTAWGWVVGTGVYADDIAATANVRTFWLGLPLLFIAAVLVGLSLAITRTITRPVRETVALLGDLAEGGDLSRRLSEGGRDELGELARAFNLFVAKLRDLIAETRGMAGHMSGASLQLSEAAGRVSEATQSQASSLQETAASLEEITGTVRQNADNARQANQLAVTSRDAAEKGGQVVGQAVAAMAEINQSSRKIADIITAIDEIAFQTNLLALNAAVEAARAGEQGRGFAVVAAEVRNLAQRSATAAKEIKALIEDSVNKVEAGSELVNRSGHTLEEIVASVKRVTGIIAEMAAAAQEQSAGVDQVNRAVTQMDHGVQTTAAEADGLSGTAQTLSSQSMQLEALVSHFKLGAEDRTGGRTSGSIGADLKKAERMAARHEGQRQVGPARPATAHSQARAKSRPVMAATLVGEAVPVGAETHAVHGSAHAGDDGFQQF